MNKCPWLVEAAQGTEPGGLVDLGTWPKPGSLGGRATHDVEAKKSHCVCRKEWWFVKLGRGMPTGFHVLHLDPGCSFQAQAEISPLCGQTLNHWAWKDPLTKSRSLSHRPSHVRHPDRHIHSDRQSLDEDVTRSVIDRNYLGLDSGNGRTA